MMKVYLDNLALAFKSQDGLNWLKNKPIQKFNMKNLSKTKTIIG